MSTNAFGARRVTESLVAIGKYLDDAVQIADGVGPGQSIRLDLAGVETAPLPILKTVTWERSQSSTLSLHDITAYDKSLDVNVTGENLGDVKFFKLLDASEAAASFSAEISFPHDGKTFKATVKTPPLVPRSFDALVSDQHGQAFLLPGACRIVEGHLLQNGKSENYPGTQAG